MAGAAPHPLVPHSIPAEWGTLHAASNEPNPGIPSLPVLVTGPSSKDLGLFFLFFFFPFLILRSIPALPQHRRAQHHPLVPAVLTEGSALSLVGHPTAFPTPLLHWTPLTDPIDASDLETSIMPPLSQGGPSSPRPIILLGSPLTGSPLCGDGGGMT